MSRLTSKRIKINLGKKPAKDYRNRCFLVLKMVGHEKTRMIFGAGFTLIESLVAVVLIAILAAVL
jgi:prepilin-type N-terminal cleavage/methylation domain-containing protein